MKRFVFTLVITLVAAGLLPAAPLVVDTVNARITLNGKNFVPIVTSHQRITDFDFWKSMGCNTTCYIESPNTWEQWTAELESSGLYGMPYGTGQLSLRHPLVIGYYLKGEPDISKDGNPPPNTTADAVNSMVRSAHTLAQEYPLMIIYEGGHLLYHLTGSTGEAYYKQASGGVELLGQDIYPLMKENDPSKIYEVASATRKLIRYLDDKKPVGAFIESGRIAAEPNRGPTPAEFEAEVWTAIGAGARYILYFPVGFDPWLRNNLKGFTANENKMKEVNALITELTDVIMEPAASVSGFKRIFTGGSIMMNMYYRRLGNDLYLIAVATRGEATTYTITFDYDGTGPIEVMGENRTEAYTSGGIDDAFTSSKAAHVYKIPGYFTGTGVREAPAAVRSLAARTEPGRLTVSFKLEAPGAVELELFDTAGAGQGRVSAGWLPAGAHSLELPVYTMPEGMYVAGLKHNDRMFAQSVMIVN